MYYNILKNTNLFKSKIEYIYMCVFVYIYIFYVDFEQ